MSRIPISYVHIWILILCVFIHKIRLYICLHRLSLYYFLQITFGNIFRNPMVSKMFPVSSEGNRSAPIVLFAHLTCFPCGRQPAQRALHPRRRICGPSWLPGGHGPGCGPGGRLAAHASWRSPFETNSGKEICRPDSVDDTPGSLYGFWAGKVSELLLQKMSNA